jgi:flagellar export protein FliJ
VKRFQFPLDAVLRVRRIREETARDALQRANYALTTADAIVAARDARYESLARPSGPMSLEAHSRMLWSLEQAAAATTFAVAERATAAGAADGARSEWATRRQDLRVLERLHDRSLAAHRTELRRAEDRLADELALARHHTGRQLI